jgi:hypothetical protein
MLAPVIVGTFDSLFAIHGVDYLTPDGKLWGKLALAAAVFCATAALLPGRSGRGLTAIGVWMFLGIALGVTIDALGDKLLFARDRLLFPIEIALWWAFAFVPVAGGLAVRALVERSGRPRPRP